MTRNPRIIGQNVFAFLLLAAFCIGCVSVSSDPEIRTTYVLIEDVFLMDVSDGQFGRRLALVPESSDSRGSGFNSSPKSAKEYLSLAKHDPWDGVVGVVSKDTSIEMLGLKKKTGYSLFYGKVTDEMHLGRIATGKFKGTTVDLEDVFRWPIKRIMPKENE